MSPTAVSPAADRSAVGVMTMPLRSRMRGVPDQPRQPEVRGYDADRRPARWGTDGGERTRREQPPRTGHLAERRERKCHGRRDDGTGEHLLKRECPGQQHPGQKPSRKGRPPGGPSSASGVRAREDLREGVTERPAGPAACGWSARVLRSPSQTTTSSSTHLAPAFLRSVCRLGHEVSVRPRTTPASMSIHGAWQMAATRQARRRRSS